MAAIRSSKEDKAFFAVDYAITTILMLIVLYPLVFVVCASFSDPNAVSAGKVILWPVGFSLEGYKAVFRTSGVLIGYRNSIFYTVLGTVFNVFVTALCAYPLSRKTLPGRRWITFFFSFTMYFGGGMIPSYLLVRSLKMLNTIWAMLIPGLLSVYNMIIVKTYFQSSVPGELLESAQIDGCSDARYFRTILIPLSKPVLAVVTLYYAVSHWNAYFNAFIYLNDRTLYPLQVFLREILVVNTMDLESITDPETMEVKQNLADLLKYSLIIVATVPMLIIYPFIQKYFAKGVMLGSLKG